MEWFRRLMNEVYKEERPKVSVPRTWTAAAVRLSAGVSGCSWHLEVVIVLGEKHISWAERRQKWSDPDSVLLKSVTLVLKAEVTMGNVWIQHSPCFSIWAAGGPGSCITPLMGMVTVINPMLIFSGWVDHLLVGLILSYCFLPVTAILLSLKTVEILENICLLIS